MRSLIIALLISIVPAYAAADGLTPLLIVHQDGSKEILYIKENAIAQTDKWVEWQPINNDRRVARYGIDEQGHQTFDDTPEPQPIPRPNVEGLKADLIALLPEHPEVVALLPFVSELEKNYQNVPAIQASWTALKAINPAITSELATQLEALASQYGAQLVAQE